MSLLALTHKVRQKELLRRVLSLHPTIFPPVVIDSIRPDTDELVGTHGVYSSVSQNLEVPEGSGGSIVFNIHLSSDGVTPYRTSASHVRCIMGSLDSVYSPELELTVKIPDSPPFIVGVYQGSDKASDIIFKTVVEELLALSPPENGDYIKPYYCKVTAWVADAPERSNVTGTLHSAGAVSCPTCTQRGTKEISQYQIDNLTMEQRTKVHNFMYFPNMDSPLRQDSDWAKYLHRGDNEVCKLLPFFLLFDPLNSLSLL